MEVFKLDYFHSPWSTVTTDDAPEDLRIATNRFRIEGTIPYYVKETKTMILNGLAYSLLTFDYDGYDLNKEPLTDLHMIQYQFHLMQFFPNQWNIMAMIRPAVASDFEGFSNRDIRANSGILLGYKFSNDLLLNFGIAYSANFGQDLILPMMGIYYQSKFFRANIMFPALVELWYLPIEMLEMGLVMKAEGSQYHFHDEEMIADYISETKVPAGPTLRVFPYKGFFIESWGGYTLYRRLEAYLNDERIYDVSPDPNWFVSGGMGYQF